MLHFIARFAVVSAALYPAFAAALPVGLDPLGAACAFGCTAAAVYEGLRLAIQKH